jgi:hypothetical protein
MANVFPTSYLPTSSQPWGREVEKQLKDLDLMVTSSDINNTARDNQLASNYRRLDATVVQLEATTAQAQSAANTAIAAAALAQSAANKANDAVDILSSLTTYTYYALASASWSGAGKTDEYVIDYYGTTYIDIPETGGQRKVIVTAVFDVDISTTNTAASTLARQSLTARIYGTGGTDPFNSTYSGVKTTATGSQVYGGGSLVVVGAYTVSASGDLSWNPDLRVTNTASGTMSGAANLRFVTVQITKV